MTAQATELEFRFQCVLCSMKMKESNGFCPRCGAPNVRDVLNTDGEYEQESFREGKSATSHFFAEVKTCMAVTFTPKNGKYVQDPPHSLTIEAVPVVNLATGEIHDVQRCSTCHRAYTKINGRVATSDEIAKCKSGKILDMRKVLWIKESNWVS